MESWLIPTIAVAIGVITLWFRITKEVTKLFMSVATKEDIKDLKSEMKSDHASLAGKVEKLDDKVDRHIEFHVGYRFNNAYESSDRV